MDNSGFNPRTQDISKSLEFPHYLGIFYHKCDLDLAQIICIVIWHHQVLFGSSGFRLNFKLHLWSKRREMYPFTSLLHFLLFCIPLQVKIKVTWHCMFYTISVFILVSVL